MYKIPLDQAEPGMVLARSINSADGRTLLGAGILLSAPFIRRLGEIGVPAIYVKDTLIGDLNPPELVSEETRSQATQAIKEQFCRINLANPILDMAKIKRSVSNLLDEVIENRNVMIHLTDVRTFDDYTFGHSVNVSVLSVLTGIALGLTQRELFDLAVGAILHDIGKMLIPIEILNKKGTFTPEEYAEMKKHTELGFEILRANRNEISSPAAHVAFQHQERFDGTGYPRGLKGAEIHKFARIAAIADVYDALVADRIYRRGYMPHEAYEFIQAKSLTEFDPDITKIFLENIAIYPMGKLVQLNTGEIGVVVDVNKAYPNRPVIRLILDNQFTPLTGSKEVDLTRHPTFFVRRILEDEEIKKVFKSSL